MSNKYAALLKETSLIGEGLFGKGNEGNKGRKLKVEIKDPRLHSFISRDFSKSAAYQDFLKPFIKKCLLFREDKVRLGKHKIYLDTSDIVRSNGFACLITYDILPKNVNMKGNLEFKDHLFETTTQDVMERTPREFIKGLITYLRVIGEVTTKKVDRISAGGKVYGHSGLVWVGGNTYGNN